MADPQKKHEITPAELRDNLSTYDPEAAAEAARPQQFPDQSPDRSGPPPENTAEQARREDKSTVEHNSPNRDRDEHLVKVGRGHHTHG
jgi:hypothetical protein